MYPTYIPTVMTHNFKLEKESYFLEIFKHKHSWMNGDNFRHVFVLKIIFQDLDAIQITLIEHSKVGGNIESVHNPTLG